MLQFKANVLVLNLKQFELFLKNVTNILYFLKNYHILKTKY